MSPSPLTNNQSYRNSLIFHPCKIYKLVPESILLSFLPGMFEEEFLLPRWDPFCNYQDSISCCLLGEFIPLEISSLSYIFNLSFLTSIFPRLQTFLANILFLCFLFKGSQVSLLGGGEQTCHLPFLTYTSFLNSLRSSFCYH